MKKVIAIMLAAVIFVSISITAFAEPLRAQKITPSLSFSGTTANCAVSISGSGKSMVATMSLWDGSVCIESWPGSGTSLVLISGSCAVESGKTYTLKVSGTIDGISFSATPVSQKCG